MKSKVHPRYKTEYRVANWAAYNQALVRRGDVTVWVSSEAVAAWTPGRSGRRGGQRRYSDLAIETSFRAVIDVTGNHDERDGVFQRRLDQVVERPCRCISEGGDEAGIDTTHPRERRVQVEVGGVEEPEAHRISSRVERLCLPCDPGRSWLDRRSFCRSRLRLAKSRTT